MKLIIGMIILIMFAKTDFYAQGKDYELGKSVLELRNNQQMGVYDLSNNESVNIKVGVWGYVRYPGKYTIPEYTTASDLINSAGGPLTDADLNDIRIYRETKDSVRQLIKFSYDDLMWSNSLSSKNSINRKLEPGDILIIPGSPRFFFREYLTITLSIVSTLISLAILILK